MRYSKKVDILDDTLDVNLDDAQEDTLLKIIFRSF